jgi:hypothetical protein
MVQALQHQGASVWFDADIEGGADWRQEIVDALTNSDMLVILFSEQCNESRQLKKELAIADRLEKPVVPILIEDTQPRGAYLYELADRNWLEAWPDPMSRIEHLVRHLVMLCGKTVDGLGGVAPAPEAPAPGAPQTVAPTPASQPSAASAPTSAERYIGKKNEPRGAAQLNDILPFRWLDLVVLLPVFGLIAWAYISGPGQNFGPMSSVGAICVIFLMAVGLYGAIAFPFRYYLRRRPLGAALVKYLISSVILFGAIIGADALVLATNLFPDESVSTHAFLVGGAWIAFTIVAFVVYGVLSGWRALRSFRSNLKRV